MQRKRLSQLVTILSLFLLLVLPTAIIGIGNFSQLVNNAFAKPFVKQDGTFLITTESSSNIAKGSEFSIKVTITAPSKIPLNYVAAFVEYDRSRVSVRSVIPQNAGSFATLEYQNGYLLYPATMVKPTKYSDLYPQTCVDNKTCDISETTMTTVVFNINGILTSDLAEQQRPIKISVLGSATGSSTYNWAEVIHLPELKLGSYIKNAAPQFTTDPTNLTKEGSVYTYNIQTADTDNDPVTLSLQCPETVFCDKAQTAPAGVSIQGNTLQWTSPKAQEKPYEITIYANDGKSVTTQTFLLRVIPKDTSYFSCTFTPAVAVKILDYNVETPLVIVADSTEELATAKVSLSRNNQVEKVFEYQFNQNPKKIILDQSSNPALIYQFKEGQYTGVAEFYSVTGEKFTCDLTNPTVSTGTLVKKAIAMTFDQIIQKAYAAVGLTVGVNNSPVFTTDPMAPAASGGSSPSVSFVYGTAYSFTLKAQDSDGDPLQHVIVAKPGWAHVNISSTTSSGSEGISIYSIAFTGTPAKSDAGSNLFSVSVNDGYGHYITRTWVINVDYPDNDIPYITIKDPTVALTRTQGQGFWLEFDITDRNHVGIINLYHTTDLNGSNKVAHTTNITYNVRKMWVSTASMAPGDYYFMLTATDSYNPPATGYAYTPLVRVLAKPQPSPSPSPKPSPSPSPSVTATVAPTASPTVTVSVSPSPTVSVTPSVSLTPTPEPSTLPDEVMIQVTSPKQNGTVTPEDFQIVATFIASKEGEVSKANTTIKIDGNDITSKVTFNPEQGKTMTASYKPATLYETGIHEISFSIKDSKQKVKDYKFSFTISGDTTPSDMVNFLGLNIDKKWYTILVAAIILLVILILLPLIMYFAFRSSDKNPPYAVAKNPNPTPVQPMGQLPPLRTPSASFATMQPRPMPAQSASIPTTQPINPQPAGPQPQPTQQTTQYPRISPQAAISSFVNQAQQQTAPKAPAQPGQVPLKPATPAVTPAPVVQQKPATPSVSPTVVVPKTAPATPQPVTTQPLPAQPAVQPKPVVSTPVTTPAMKPMPVQTQPQPQAQVKPAPVNQPAAAQPKPIPVTISTTPAAPSQPKPPAAPANIPTKTATTAPTIPVVQQNQQPKTANTPQFVPVTQPMQKPAQPAASTPPAAKSTAVPPESPSIPKAGK